MSKVVQSGPRETRRAGEQRARIEHYLKTTTLTPEAIADILSSDVARRKSLARQIYQVRREMELAAGIDRSVSLGHRVAELEERVRALEATLAEIRRLPADPVARRLALG